MIDKQSIIIGYHRDGKSKKQLSRDLKISLKSVKKYIRLYEKEMQSAELSKEALPKTGVIQAPRYNSSNRVKTSLTPKICELIDQHLTQNKIKRQSGRHKQQMKKIDIHQALVDADYEVSYSSVCRYIRGVEAKGKEVFIRQHYEAGQAIEFDWGEVKIFIKEKLKRKMLAVFTSSYSNHRWARLYDRQDMSSFLHSHTEYFASVGGVARQVVYDNMRTAVRKFTLRNQDKLPTDQLLKMSCYYQFDYRFCNARKGNEKGHVERSVEYIRRKAFAPQEHFESLSQANDYLLQTCQRLNQKPQSGKTQSIQSVFEEELPYMKSVPPAYDTGELTQLKVDKYSCVKVDTNYYSVPEGHVGSMLEVKIYADKILIYPSDCQDVTVHQRAHTRFEYYLQIDHYLKTLRTKPGALMGSLTLAQADEQLQNIFVQHFKKRPKDFVEVLLFVRQKQLSIAQLQEAISKCLTNVPHQAIHLDTVKLLLQSNDSVAASTIDRQNPPDEFSKNIAQHCHQQLKDIQTLMA